MCVPACVPLCVCVSVAQLQRKDKIAASVTGPSTQSWSHLFISHAPPVPVCVCVCVNKQSPEMSCNEGHYITRIYFNF